MSTSRNRVNHFLVLLYCIFMLFFEYSNGQTLSKSIEKEYYQLENLEESYDSKVGKIKKYIAQKAPYIPKVELSLLHNYFSKFSNRHKDYKNAISNAKKAIELQKEFIDSVPSLLNKSYNNLAYMYKYAGDETSAIDTFITLTKQPHKDAYVIKAYCLGLSNLYIRRGDYYKAIDYLKEAEEIIKNKNNPKLTKELYRVYLAFSLAYYKTQKQINYTKTIEYLEKGEKAISHLPQVIQKKRQIEIYNRYGNTYDELKQFDKAITYYLKALNLSINLKKRNDNHISQIYNNLGYIYARIQKHDIAYQYYQKALQYDPVRTSVFDNLGDYYLFKEDFIQALQHYQTAINYAVNGDKNCLYEELPSIKTLETSSNKIGIENYLKDKANAWYKFYSKTREIKYLKHALNTILLADQIIDAIRSDSREQQSKYFWRQKGIDLYMLATAICYDLNDYEKAFYFMEKSKALSLLEDLTHEEAKSKALLPRKIIEKEYHLKQQIYTITEQLKSDSTYTDLQKESLIFQHKKKYDHFINSLEAEYPGYYGYKKNIDILPYHDVLSDYVSPSNTIVQYLLSENEGYGIFISDQKTQFYKIPNANILNKEIRRLNELISKPFTTPEQQKTYTKISLSVYDKLFPFENATELLTNKKILIIPDFLLQNFPFEALVTQPNIKNNIPEYLLNSTEISYNYSMSLLKKIEQKKRNPKFKLIGFAPIQFKEQKLTRLNRSKYKMQKAGQYFPAKILYQDEAIKDNFITYADHYQIIHLSTHASSEPNQEPWIAFYDDKVTLNELYFIRNQADLVILDACKTNIGELKSGEGVMSLSRGFFHSGSLSVISSLWSTNEKSSSQIILDFYKNLKQGKTKSAALREAKLTYLREHQLSESSPYFWAPLTLTGSTKNSSLQKNNLIPYMSLLFLLLLSLGITFLRKE